MKLVLATLVLIFMTQAFMAQDFVTLDNSTLDSHPLIRDLRDLGAAYVGQQIIFHPNKVIYKDYYKVTDTIKVERKVTPNVTYYRYTVILTETDHYSVVKAGYTVNYKPSNGGFVVSSYYYRIIADNLNGQTDLHRPIALNIKDFNEKKLDSFYPLFESNLEIAIAKAISSKLLPQAQYYHRFFYDAFFVYWRNPDVYGDDFTSNPRYTCLVKLVNNKNEFYRMRFSFLEEPDNSDPSNSQVYVYPNL